MDKLMTHLSLGPSSVSSPLKGEEFLEDLGGVLAWGELTLDVLEEALVAWVECQYCSALLPLWGELALAVWGEALSAWD